MAICAVVVDDEPLARAKLKRMLKSHGVDILAEGVDGEDAIELTRSLVFDILFLDINMPRKDGLEAARQISVEIPEPPAIVFCTAYDQYAIRAFEANATSYLLKPIESSSLALAIERAGRVSRLQISQLESTRQNKTLAVHYEGALQKISVDRFAYFHSEDKNVFAVMNTGEEVLMGATLKQLEDKLVDDFIRIHRGALINRTQAKRLLKDEGGRPIVELELNATQLTISRRHLTKVKECFK